MTEDKLMKKHICLICGSEFETNRRDAKTCSPKCRQAAYRDRQGTAQLKLKIDKEFSEIKPPLTAEEYAGLEKNLLENGFNPAMPIIVWKGQNIVIDGHNRLGICQKHNIPYETIEQEFASRLDVEAWILDNQLFRRNINSLTRTDLIGRRYAVEKNLSVGRPEGSKEFPHFEGIKKYGVAKQVADKLNVGHATVERAEKLSKAIDIITANTGVERGHLLTKVKCTHQDILELTKLNKNLQITAMKAVIDKKDDVGTAIYYVLRDEDTRREKEAEKNRAELEKQLEEDKKKRVELEKQEKERLRAEREAAVKETRLRS